MPNVLFSPAWADALCHTLNASDAYREAAATWEGDLVLRVTDDPRAVYLDLHRGACRSAAAGADATAHGAAFEIAATLETWQSVLAGTLDPILGMMLGKLSVRGDMARIAAHAKAAKALVACAATVDAT